jgi:hypothetical protein
MAALNRREYRALKALSDGGFVPGETPPLDRYGRELDALVARKMVYRRIHLEGRGGDFYRLTVQGTDYLRDHDLWLQTKKNFFGTPGRVVAYFLAYGLGMATWKLLELYFK